MRHDRNARRNHKKVPPLLLSSLLWLIPCATFAADSLPAFSAGLGVSFMHFDYREFKDNGSLMDREKGYLPGIDAQLTHVDGPYAISAHAAYFSHVIDYAGETVNGVPISTSTSETLTEFSAQLSRQLSLGESMAGTLYGGLGYREWKRDIHSTSTATGPMETYRWPYFFAGIQPRMLSSDGYELCADLHLIRSIRPAIRIDFHDLYDNASLALGAAYGFRLGLPLRLARQNGITLTFEPYWEQWKFGRSSTEALTKNSASAGTVFEPKSETRAYGLTLGVASNF